MVEFDANELPEEVDPVEKLEKKAEKAEEQKLSFMQQQGRELALRRGKALGTDEANLRGETGTTAEQRIKRAMAYAAWEFDGKPSDYGDRYAKEFGIRPINSFSTPPQGDARLRLQEGEAVTDKQERVLVESLARVTTELEELSLLLVPTLGVKQRTHHLMGITRHNLVEAFPEVFGPEES